MFIVTDPNTGRTFETDEVILIYPTANEDVPLTLMADDAVLMLHQVSLMPYSNKVN